MASLKWIFTIIGIAMAFPVLENNNSNNTGAVAYRYSHKHTKTGSHIGTTQTGTQSGLSTFTPGSGQNVNPDLGSSPYPALDSHPHPVVYDETSRGIQHRHKAYVYDTNSTQQWQREKFPETKLAQDLEWNLTHKYYAPDGVWVSGFFINGQSPGPALVAHEGEWVRIVVNNFLPVPITIHFHGIDQVYTPWADGVPGVTQYPILSGGSYEYIFQFNGQRGSFWYHAHFRAYFQDGVMGPINILPADSVKRPYSAIEGVSLSDAEYIQTLETSAATNIMVTDVYGKASDDITARLLQQDVLPSCASSIIINGKGRVVCNTQEEMTAALKSRHLPFVPDTWGCFPGYPLESDAVAANAAGVGGYHTSCLATDNDREVIYTNNQKYIYWHLFNMSPESNKVFSVDEHDLIVVAVDGVFVKPKVVQQLYLPLATRYTVVIKPKQNVAEGSVYAVRFALNDVFQLKEGIALLVYGTNSTTANETSTQLQALTPTSIPFQGLGGNLLSSSHISASITDFVPYDLDLHRPSQGAADHTIHLDFNGTSIYFSMFPSGSMFKLGSELDAPFLLQTDPAKLDFDSIGDCAAPGIKLGQTVDIIIKNPLIVPHVFHMHGHSFSIISHSSDAFKYENVASALQANKTAVNLEDPIYVDTIDVPGFGHVVARFTAHNPGYWFMHCHVNHHLTAGMAGFIVIDEKKIPKIPYALYNQPHADYDSSVDIEVSFPSRTPENIHDYDSSNDVQLSK